MSEEMAVDEWDVQPGRMGIRLKYQGNVLYCATYRTTRENLDACLQALGILIGSSVEQIRAHRETLKDEGLTIETYTSS